MALFGRNDGLQQILEDFANISAKLDSLEKRMDDYCKQQSEINKKLAEVKTDVDAMKSEYKKALYNLSAEDNIKQDSSHQEISTENSLLAKTVFLAPPSSDGSFENFSDTEQIGKSVYILKTDDGKSGAFSMIDSSDALATAMISVSQFVKSVCRIEGDTRAYPSHITTIEKGMAVKEKEMWKMTKKALVKFE